MLLGYDWSEDHPQSQSPFFGQFFGLMNNPGYVLATMFRSNIFGLVYRGVNVLIADSTAEVA